MSTAGGAGQTGSGDHGTAAAIELLPVTGLPQFCPGDDLTAAVAAAAPWLRDNDVVVVTSKVVSKCEGRIIAAPADPEQRDALRRKLIDEEAVRVLARKGRTLITENALGLVQAAAGVDGSNVAATELALCSSARRSAPSRWLRRLSSSSWPRFEAARVRCSSAPT